MSESSGRPENAQETSSLASELAAVLGAYLGELVESKRAALLGDGGTALPSALAEASGRRVHVFDPDAEQTAAAIARSRGGSGNGNVRYALFENDAADRYANGFSAAGHRMPSPASGGGAHYHQHGAVGPGMTQHLPQQPSARAVHPGHNLPRGPRPSYPQQQQLPSYPQQQQQQPPHGYQR